MNEVLKYMRKSSLRLSILVFFIVMGTRAYGQRPFDYFLGGANYYINGKTEEAKSVVAQGLVKFPDDKKLLALKKKIEEEKPQDNKNKQDQNKDQKDNQDKQKQQQQQNQQQQQQNQDKQQQQQEQQAISREDAQRVLDAVANDEKNVQEKVKLAKAQQGKVRTVKNW